MSQPAPMPVAPDADRSTCHVRSSANPAAVLTQAGFIGAQVILSDPLCQGPVSGGPEMIAVRAAFLEDAYGLDRAASQSRLATEAQALDGAVAEALAGRGRLVLWFGHDPRQQLALARVLAQVAGQRAGAGIDVVCVDRFPGIEPFHGLDQLNPEQLRSLWPRRRPLSPGQVSLGARVWAALQADSPVPLHILACGGTPAMPLMAPALRRHLAELPGMDDGLALSERLILRAVNDGAASVADILARLRITDPLPFLDEGMVLPIIGRLIGAADPGLDVTEGADDPMAQVVALTATGRAVLAGRRDWLDCGPAARWVGGVKSAAGTPVMWRWDGGAGPYSGFGRPVQVRG